MGLSDWSIETKGNKIKVSYKSVLKGSYDLTENGCDKCSYPLDNRCINCDNHPDFIEKIFSIGVYHQKDEGDHFLSKHIAFLKKNQEMVAPLGLALCEILRKIPHYSSLILTYVPQHRDELHEDRFTQEKFDQAKELAQFVSENTQIPYYELLVKKQVNSQKDKNRNQRLESAKDLYICKKETNVEEIVKDGSICIIDDVITTSADIDACARVIADYKPKVIYGLSCGITHRRQM